jgi:hypothetical protein
VKKLIFAIGLIALVLCIIAAAEPTSTIAKKDDNVKEAENDRNEDKSVDTKHDTITSEKQNEDGSTTVEITKVPANSPDDANPIIDNNGDKQCQSGHTDCGKPKITCPPGFKVRHGICNKDIFIKVHKHSSSTTSATYITGTLVDCNVVFATPIYFSKLAINLCNQQYEAK